MEQSDLHLIDYLCKCDPKEIHTIINLMKSKFSSSSRTLANRFVPLSAIPRAKTEKRKELANELTALLRWYSSDALAYGIRHLFQKEGGVHYHKIVKDVAKQLNGHLKKKDRIKPPVVATVDEWEDLIVRLLLMASVKDKSREEIAQMLMEAGLDETAAAQAAKKFTIAGIAAATLPTLVYLLGKKTITVLIEQIAVAIIYKFVGKEAAQTLAKRFLIKFAQRTIAKIISGVGWILLGLDVLLFATSPANRIMVPTIATISTFRFHERMKRA